MNTRQSKPRKAMLSLTTLALGTGMTMLALPPAQAAPLPADYSGNASSDLVTVRASLLGLPSLAEVKVGSTSTDVDSARANNDATARSSNLGLGLGGQALPLDNLEASAAPVSDPAGRALVPLNLAPLVNLGALNGDVGAFYISDTQCPAVTPSGRVSADAKTELAGLTLVDIPGTNTRLAQVGAVASTSTTKLVPDSAGGADVVSTVTTTVADTSLLGGQLRIELSDDVVLTSRSDGSQGVSQVNNVLIRVFAGDELLGELPVGSGQTLDVPVPLGLLNANVKISAGQFSDLDAGAVARGDLDSIVGLNILVEDAVANLTVADVDLSVAGSNVRAQAPTGGVECATAGSNTDTDNDGLTDAQEADMGTNPNMPDTDSDGLTDGQEVELGTDPTKADTDNDGLQDGFEVVIGTNPVKADTDNGGVNDGTELNNGTNPNNPADDSSVTPGLDTDNDGLPDATEVQLGSNPLVADTDGDGLTDGSEVNTFKTDPMKADTDADGLSDYREVMIKTNPVKADTDNDGLNDGKEVAIKTNPLNKDTDRDGLSDGREVNGIKMALKVRTKAGVKTVKTVRTNPLAKDTDKDGLSDKMEVTGYKIKQKVVAKKTKGKTRTYVIGKVRSNPLKKDTDNDGLTDKQEKTGSANKRFNKHKTSPVNWDTDFGGVSDGKEVKKRTDPSTVKNKKRMM